MTESYHEFQKIDMCLELFQILNGAIIDNPPLTLKEGGVFVDGYHEELDELRRIMESAFAISCSFGKNILIWLSKF